MANAPWVETKMVVNRAPGLAVEIRSKMTTLARKAGLMIAAQAKIGVVLVNAIDTGNLLGSYHVVFPMPGEALAGTRVHYAPYVEFGTYKMPARPHFGPAVDRTKLMISASIRELAS